ncbi:MAG TPA: DUF4337 family protein [Sphingobium sp.]|uniref:DUF4337 family protein n=1 Tax=Sphingobium sp. TaxID=1912891 RepID=UPI002ED5F27B
MEAAEAKDLIEDAVEESEARHDVVDQKERLAERRFRNRVSLLVGLFAVLLAIVHMVGASASRDSLLSSIEASDTFAYMQAKIVRETVLRSAADTVGDTRSKARDLAEADRLKRPDAAQHGISQLRERGDELRAEGTAKAAASEGYELGETALQLAIVILSIALIAQSWPIAFGACFFAVTGTAIALFTALGGRIL